MGSKTRLARRLFQQCREPYNPERETLEYLDPPTDREVTFCKPKGCDTCSASGYKDRVGIYEVLRVTQDIPSLVVERAPTDEIREAAPQNGMLTRKDYGLMLLKEGMTSVEEALQCVVVKE